MLISLLVKNFITKTLLTALMSLYWLLGSLMLGGAAVVYVFREDVQATQSHFLTATREECLTAACFYYSAGGALALAVICAATGLFLVLFGLILNLWIRAVLTAGYAAAAVWIWIWLLGEKL